MDTRREIVAGIQPDIAGDYEDQDGARNAARKRTRLRKMTREIDAAHDMDLTGFHADLNEGVPLAGLDDPRPANVVQPQFSDPLKAGRTADPEREAIVKDFWDRQLAAQKERKAGA